MATFFPSGCSLIFGDHAVLADGLVFEGGSGETVFYGNDGLLVDTFEKVNGSCFLFSLVTETGIAKRFNASAELMKMENGSIGLCVKKLSDSDTNIVS